MKVYVRCALIELGITFAAGYFLGRYLEKKVIVTVKDGQTIQAEQPKKKSVSYTDGKIIIDLKR